MIFRIVTGSSYLMCINRLLCLQFFKLVQNIFTIKASHLAKVISLFVSDINNLKPWKYLVTMRKFQIIVRGVLLSLFYFKAHAIVSFNFSNQRTSFTYDILYAVQFSQGISYENSLHLSKYFLNAHLREQVCTGLGKMYFIFIIIGIQHKMGEKGIKLL